MDDQIQPDAFVSGILNSPLVRLALVVILALLLMIPITIIGNVISERRSTRDSAVQEITSKWGHQQSIHGPMLVVPYIQKYTEKEKDGSTTVRTRIHHASFLPDELKMVAQFQGETRYRGIFQVPVYAMSLDITGSFARPDFSDWSVAPEEILWDQGHLTLQISDPRAITQPAALQWNQQTLSFMPGAGPFGASQPAIHVPLKGQWNAQTFAFSCRLELNGSQSAFFAPFGRQTLVEARSNWSTPSFQGNWLPTQRTVTEQGFQAQWNIPFLGRNYPQKWTDSRSFDSEISAAVFGVTFLSPMDYYRMSERSIKYSLLFIALTFITLWLFEILGRVRIHVIQYLLLGAGLCLFYLLELSLAEHIGFNFAYVLATLAVTALIAFYSAFVLRSYRRASILSLMILLLYGYLYILLMNQDYALLVGSVCLFLLLAVVMYVTRKVDWRRSTASLAA